MPDHSERSMLADILAALDPPEGSASHVTFDGDDRLPSCFAASELAVASAGAAAAAVFEPVGLRPWLPRLWAASARSHSKPGWHSEIADRHETGPSPYLLLPDRSLPKTRDASPHRLAAHCCGRRTRRLIIHAHRLMPKAGRESDSWIEAD